jgi:uncharacterized membrane protein
MKKDVSVYRHIAKTVSWRVIGTIDTMVLGFLITGDFTTAITIGSLEVFSKMILYFVHERVWYKIPFGVSKSQKTD